MAARRAAQAAAALVAQHAGSIRTRAPVGALARISSISSSSVPSALSSIRCYSGSTSLAQQSGSEGGTTSQQAAQAQAAPAAKPRATSGAASAKRKRHVLLTSVLGGSVAFIAWLSYKYKSVDEALAALKQMFEGVKDASVTDPTLEELQRALGPPSPDFYINVIIAMEDVLVKREWDRRYGWRYEIRPGVKEMFKALLDAGAMATLWSEASGAVRCLLHFTGTVRYGLQCQRAL